MWFLGDWEEEAARKRIVEIALDALPHLEHAHQTLGEMPRGKFSPGKRLGQDIQQAQLVPVDGGKGIAILASGVGFVYVWGEEQIHVRQFWPDFDRDAREEVRQLFDQIGALTAPGDQKQRRRCLDQLGRVLARHSDSDASERPGLIPGVKLDGTRCIPTADHSTFRHGNASDAGYILTIVAEGPASDEGSPTMRLRALPTHASNPFERVRALLDLLEPQLATG